MFAYPFPRINEDTMYELECLGCKHVFTIENEAMPCPSCGNNAFKILKPQEAANCFIIHFPDKKVECPQNEGLDDDSVPEKSGTKADMPQSPPSRTQGT